MANLDTRERRELNRALVTRHHVLGDRLQNLDSDGNFTGTVLADAVTDTLTVGEFASLLAGSGTAISASQLYAGAVYADDAGADLDAADSVRGLLSRFLLTTDQNGCSIRALQGQLKMATGVDLTLGVYTALQGYVEMAGTHIAKTGSTFSCADLSMEIKTSLTVDSGGEACGLHVETTGAGSITNNGTCAGVLIDKASGAASWPIGLFIPTGCTRTPIKIGTWISNTASTGHVLAALAEDSGAGASAAIGVYCDDGGAAVTGITTPVFSRYLLTVDQSSGGTQTALFAHLKSGGTSTRTYASVGIRGAYIFNQLAATTLSGNSELVTINAATSLAGTMTVGTGTKWAGLDINLAGSQTVTVQGTGIAAALMIRAKDTAKWPIGIYLEDSAGTTAIQIGACTTGISFAGDATTAISIGDSCTPTDGILISGACADAIHISGTNTSTALHISGDQVVGILYDVDADATDGLKMSVDTLMTLSEGIEMSGAGTITTGIHFNPAAATTGILIAGTAVGTGISITSGSLTDAIKISAATPDDGIEISSVCGANAINISGASLVGLAVAGCTTGISLTGTMTTGLSISPAACTKAIAVGSEAFVTAGSGLPLDGVTKHEGVSFYFDDGGVKLAAGYTEALRAGFLVSTAITTADVSLYTAHDYVYLAADVTTAGGVGGTWGSMLVKAGVTITTSSGLCDFSGAHFTCEVPSTAVIGTGTWACGVSVGGNLGGTHTGNAAGYRVRVPSAGKWDAAIRIEPTSCVEYLQVGTASFSAAGTGIPLDGVTQHSGAEIYFDDGGVKLAAGYTEAVMTGFLVSTAITTADVSLYTAHDYVYLAADVTTAGGVGAAWASMLVKAGVTITTSSGVCDFSAFNASCDVPSTAVIGTGTFVSGISMGGNLGGTHTGKAVAFRVRSPSAGAWDGLCDIPSALTASAGSGGVGSNPVKIPIFVAGATKYIIAADNWT